MTIGYRASAQLAPLELGYQYLKEPASSVIPRIEQGSRRGIAVFTADGTAMPEGVSEVKARIEAAARASKREISDITLIAVSKTFPAEDIEPLLRAGHQHFGENRVQEAKAKWPGLKAQYPECRLHLIGPLQSNKAAEAVRLFDAIHTIDRPKLASMVVEEMRKQQRQLELFIQVNTGEEAQKSGVMPSEADGFIRVCRESGMAIAGLMCLPPIDEEPSLHFALLAKIGKRNGLSRLSMGMSGDLEKAIAFGATHVRVGTAIFGSRPRLNTVKNG
jgi:PLP dependent protein